MHTHKKIIKRHFKVTIPMLTVVELEINTHCNRRCSYCPNSFSTISDVSQYMSDEVYHRILEELSKINFDGRISYHFYNEPLLRDDLEYLITQSSERLPDAHQVLFTNGDFLSEERYHRLKEVGVNHFIITRHSSISIPERPLQTVLFPDELQMTNRGGGIPHLSMGIQEISTLPCYASSEMLVITFNGDIVQCYEDAKRLKVMGNIMESSIENIWYSDNFCRLRQLLMEGRRKEGGTICSRCNNQAHTKSGTCFSAL